MWSIKRSKIHGYGIIATKDIKQNTNIDCAFDGETGDDKNITEFGKHVNHSYTPNCILKFVPVLKSGTWNVYSIVDICRGEEITCNYNDTPNFIEKAPFHFK